MSHEALNNQPTTPAIDPAVVAQWMEVKDVIAPYDQLVQIDRGTGPEEVVLRDALYKRSEVAGEPAAPIVNIENADGSWEEIPAQSFLEWSKFDPSSLETRQSKEQIEPEAAAFAGHAAVEAVTNYETKRRAEREIRAEKLFAVPEYLTAKTQETSYDHFFTADPQTPVPQKQKWGVEKPKPKAPEAEDIAAASSQLLYAMQTDAKVAGIVGKYIAETVPYVDKVKELQTNVELRKELGIYFLDKMDHADVWRMMPSRVARDQQKSSNDPRYDRIGYMTSREYACMIAMSMLDGTFDVSAAASEKITISRTNPDGVGQHRTAAKTLLEYSDRQWSPSLGSVVGIWDK